ncbi:MAG: hypothetical protein U0795_14020 [Pirellulales bacterium]
MSDSQSDLSGARLSLRSIFTIVTICTFAAGLFRVLGGFALVWGAICWVFLAGVVAVQSGQGAAYGRFITSGMILFLLFILPPPHLYFDSSRVAFTCVLMGTGGYLAVSTIWKAHWATRILGILLSMVWAVVYYQMLVWWVF